MRGTRPTVLGIRESTFICLREPATRSCIAYRCSSEGGFPVRIAPYPKRPLPTAQRHEIEDFLRCFLQNSALCTLGVLLFGDASPADASDDIEPPLLETVATEVYRFSRLSFGQGEGPTPRSLAPEARLLFASARRRPLGSTIWLQPKNSVSRCWMRRGFWRCWKVRRAPPGSSGADYRTEVARAHGGPFIRPAACLFGT